MANVYKTITPNQGNYLELSNGSVIDVMLVKTITGQSWHYPGFVLLIRTTNRGATLGIKIIGKTAGNGGNIRLADDAADPELTAGEDSSSTAPILYLMLVWDGTNWNELHRSLVYG